MLQADERRYQSVAIGALITLSDFDRRFNHLARLDDGATKTQAARAALDEVIRVISQHKALLDDVEGRKAAREAEAAAARLVWAQASDRDELKTEFYGISGLSNAQQRGLALEPFLKPVVRLLRP